MIRFLGRLEELDSDRAYRFPPIQEASPEGIVCAGGNLSPGMLLSAYRQGIFPWYNDDEPILWWSPNPRFAVLPETLHVSHSSVRLLRKADYGFSLDKKFRTVMEACAKVFRPGQEGTWIRPEMIEAYTRLHYLGYAHSLEVWKDGLLVGGLYGISLGGAFFGESMFSLSPGASRAGFLSLALWLFDQGFLAHRQSGSYLLCRNHGRCRPAQGQLYGKIGQKPFACLTEKATGPSSFQAFPNPKPSPGCLVLALFLGPG